MKLRWPRRNAHLGVTYWMRSTLPHQHIQQKRDIYLSNPLWRDESSCNNNDSNKSVPKPDLKRVAREGKLKQSRFIIAACILVTIYMYPMIFKPLFSIGTTAEEELSKRKEAGLDPSKTRPSNMPDWSSPFGPKSRED